MIERREITCRIAQKQLMYAAAVDAKTGCERNGNSTELIKTTPVDGETVTGSTSEELLADNHFGDIFVLRSCDF